MKFENVEANSERWFNLKLLEDEEWLPLKILKKGKIYDYSGYYEISNYGRVKSMGIYHGKTNHFFNRQHILKAKINKDGYLFDNVPFVEDYLDDRYPRECHYSKTIGEFAREHPYGRYAASMNNHITAIIDGVIVDTFDCSDRVMRCAWKIN